MKPYAAAALILAACSSPAPSPRTPAGDTGRAVRFMIGQLEAYALEDGHLVVPNDGKLLAVGRPPGETGDVLAGAGLSRDEIRLDIQCLLVKTRDRVILFDAGAGAFVPTAGRLVSSLALAGVAPGAVTDIFISHAHSDHIGGLVTKDGALVYPAAKIRMSSPEWAAFQAEAANDADARRFVAALAPVVAAFDPDLQVLPLVKAIGTPGHTVGHSSFEIGDAGGRLLYLGDIAHHAVISLQRPAWSIAVDGDKPAAEALRGAMLAKLSAEHTRVFAGHFPFTGVGRVVAAGDGFMWKPE